ncbi:hypothetical protein DdX_16118 [Ditylenchus destructor]|uniref:MARVEL domain-containing protein n=1 Tax=Ditylenchus destructor TaxID=166010 RepID=A0AAD4MP87_9BILA|nr:hypothetical protein DdX_16118 [Ditylenchus destructor]
MNTNYLSGHRGIIKIIQIIIGFVLVSTTFGGLFGYHHVGYSDFRMGYVGTLNGICIIVNIVFLILNLLELAQFQFEKIYSVVACVLWLIASIFVVWLMIATNTWSANPIISVVLIVIMFVLFLYDVKILQGEA